MNKKPRVPSEKEILDAYRILQSEVEIPVREWVRFSQWVRFDPRLGEVWLSALDRRWRALPPVLMRDENLQQATPAVLGVLLDQYHDFVCPEADRKTFDLWRKIALEGLKKAPNENFFIGVAPFAGKRLRLDAERPIRAYKKWGFFGRDILVNKFSEKQKELQVTALAPEERRRALDSLLRSKPRITVSDYVEACEGMISRRMAQKDLQARKGLRCTGSTRARFYSLERRNRP